MAELRLLPLEELFNEAQMSTLRQELSEIGVDGLPAANEEDAELNEVLGDDALTDFMDRLEAHDLACAVYLPVEFEGTFSVAETTVGSAHALIEALEELRVELDIDEEGDADSEDDLDLEVIEEQLRHVWSSFLRAANTCIERQIPLRVVD